MTPEESRQSSSDDPRIPFAAERTLLAWIRTGLALMGFGFVVARFGLFLREIASVRGLPSTPRTGFSMAIGTTLVVLGVTVTLSAAIGHWRTMRRLEHGRPLRFSPLSLATSVALLLAFLGTIIAVYLLVGLDEAS